MAGDPWHAVIDSAVLRFRPIMLTAAAAILGMVPLMTSVFWGPMAVAIASGLLVATVLTSGPADDVRRLVQSQKS